MEGVNRGWYTGVPLHRVQWWGARSERLRDRFRYHRKLTSLTPSIYILGCSTAWTADFSFRCLISDLTAYG
ncbi:hypothetical protein EZ315_10270 [Duncaniella freteri]|uniref:Uncharacterized protein n=1 Tax=Duncaniella freteri TaxID=2530391 RepID=A0A4Z0V1H6_9BACT|nr:hypothetical protein EZ315_10270 [Duncaniella freteri]